MPRRRNVPITKGEKRIVGQEDSLRIEQTLFCGECGRRLKSAVTQKPHSVVARVCENSENHKNGKIHLWFLDGVEVVGYSN